MKGNTTVEFWAARRTPRTTRTAASQSLRGTRIGRFGFIRTTPSLEVRSPARRGEVVSVASASGVSRQACATSGVRGDRSARLPYALLCERAGPSYELTGGFAGRLSATTGKSASATHKKANASTEANVGSGSAERLASVAALKTEMTPPPIMPRLRLPFRIGLSLPHAHVEPPGRDPACCRTASR